MFRPHIFISMFFSLLFLAFFVIVNRYSRYRGFRDVLPQNSLGPPLDISLHARTHARNDRHTYALRKGEKEVYLT